MESSEISETKPMRGLETDYVFSGLMIGLKINFTVRVKTYKPSNRHRNLAQRAESVKSISLDIIPKNCGRTTTKTHTKVVNQYFFLSDLAIRQVNLLDFKKMF